MTDAIAAVGFLIFIGLGLRVAGAEALSEPVARRRITTLVAYTLVASLVVGFSRHDLWPFASWQMMRWASTAEAREPRLLGVTADGAGYPIDYRAWQPLSLEELSVWLDRRFPRLPPAEQDSVFAYLLARANHGRTQALRGEGVGYLDRYLGPFWAPTHLLHPRIWAEPPRVPADAFVALQLVVDSWIIEQRSLDSTRFTRRTIYRFPR